jgi:type IV pilus assembly protein PilY1
VIKEFTGMDKSMAAPPTAVDAYADGYVDKVYIGDIGGQMWVFDVSSSEIGAWIGKKLFAAPAVTPEKHPIYTQPAVAFDRRGTPWVYFGTGDRENPTDKVNQERFYAVKDDGKGVYPRTEVDLSPKDKDVIDVPSKHLKIP